MQKAPGFRVGAMLVLAGLAACAADDSSTSGGAGPLPPPQQMMPATGVAGASAAGTGARPPTAGMMGVAGTQGMIGTAGTGAMVPPTPGCSASAPDGDDDGMPDCMDDEPPMDPEVDPDACTVAPIPDQLRQDYDFDAFYTRYASALGVPIVSSDSPADEAMRRACMIVLDFSSGRDDVRPSMLENKIYFIMMGADEKTVDTPEFRSLGDIDQRARGLGSMQAALCAEESVMCDRSDRWYGESICVHEYSHTMHLGVFTQVDPMFNAELRAAYDNARSMGLWANTYADDNTAEYFGEAVQSWYNTNQVARRPPSDGVHNEINTKDELEAYDPMMYQLLSEFLPAQPQWRDCYYYE